MFAGKLDYAAAEIQKLQAANVPLLWAPVHESQPNGWFWWSKGTGTQYVQLWTTMYDYFTRTKGLNNIIWLMPFSGSPMPPPSAIESRNRAASTPRRCRGICSMKSG